MRNRQMPMTPPSPQRLGYKPLRRHLPNFVGEEKE